MTPAEIYSVARNAGFPPSTAVSMTAIAMRESGGNPQAFNGVPPDSSYGLWQINMIGSLGPARLAQFGLSDASELFDPNVNAMAAYAIWGGDDANLSRHWYIDRPVYKERYEAYLPAAQEAAQQVEGIAVDPATGGDALGISSAWASLSDDEKLIVGGVAAIAVGVLVMRVL